MKQEKLFNEMMAAIEKANELELQFLIAKREKEALIEAYRALSAEEAGSDAE